MVRCPKTAEVMDMPFWMKTRMGPRNHVLDGGADPSRGRAIFGGCLGHSEALAIFATAIAVVFAATGIIQSPTTSCSRQEWDHSVCQASTNSIRKIYG